MDRNGIVTAITSISAPGLWLGEPDARRALTHECNEYAARMRSDHPGRFGIFASLPLPDVDASLREIEHALDVLKADGIGLLTSYGRLYPGDASLAPVFDELDRRRAVVFFHPVQSPCCSGLLGIPAATLEFPFDTTNAVASLLYSGTLARCPSIRFIFSHAGGTVPFLADRMARLEARPDIRAKVPQGVLFELKRLFFDTALSANASTLSALLQPPRRTRCCSAATIPSRPRQPWLRRSGDSLSTVCPAMSCGQSNMRNAMALLPSIRAGQAA